MNIKKGLVALFCLCMLSGCSSNQKKENGKLKTEEESLHSETITSLYAGLNSKDTYEKACDYFSEKVYYVREIHQVESSVNPGVSCYETFIENGKKNAFLKQITKHISVFNVFKDGKFYDGSPDIPEESQKLFYESKQEAMFVPLTKRKNNDNVKNEIIDIQKEEKDEEIIISIKYKTSSANVDNEGNKKWDSYYHISNTYIDKSGMIYKVSGYETDKDFKNKGAQFLSTFLDINKKKTFNFDEEVTNIKKYEKTTYEEFKKELGIN